MTNPLVTIIIPSYNHAPYIEHTINSILKQSLQNFELLIVDDNSTDNSLKIIKKFQDKRLKTFFLEKNIGMCKASNLMIEEAKGEYLSIIASDDIMKPDNLKNKINFLQNNPEYGAVFSQIEIINDENKVITRKTKKSERFFPAIVRNRYEWLNYFFFNGNCIAAPTFVARTESVKRINGFNNLIFQAHDFDMWVRLCLEGYEMFVLPEKLVQYRQSNKNKSLSRNTTSVRKRLVFDNEKILENFLSIKKINDLVKIFPDLLPLKSKISDELIPSLIALQSLKVGGQSIYHQQFALNILYHELKNQQIQEKLEKEFNFTNEDFFKLVSNNPLGKFSEEINKKTLFRKVSDKLSRILDRS